MASPDCFAHCTRVGPDFKPGIISPGITGTMPSLPLLLYERGLMIGYYYPGSQRQQEAQEPGLSLSFYQDLQESSSIPAIFY